MAWGALRGVRNPELIQPLIATMRNESDEKTSLYALGLLQSDYAGTDPAVREAFELVARDDRRELVRQAAQWILYGDAGWHEYVVGNLGNASLPDDVRLAPLGYMTQSRELSAQLPAVMDDPAVAALAGMLPRLWSNRVHSQTVMQVLNVLSQKQHPGGIRLATEALRTGPERLVNQLVIELAGYQDDPAMRKALDEASVRFPQLRALVESQRASVAQ